MLSPQCQNNRGTLPVGLADAPKQPLIGLCLEDIDRAIGDLNDTITRLIQKTEPICSPLEPRKEANEKSPDSFIPVVKRLSDQKDTIRHLTNILQDLNRRIEL